MWLNDLLTGGQVNNANHSAGQTAPAVNNHNAQVGRQLQSLVPGQTIQGEVVSRNGSEVQIKVADDLVLNARVDQNMQLEVGKKMTFEVRNNGQSLTLSPLFANTATDANVLKALDMAAMPVNEATVAMTEQMMNAGLPVNRQSLQQMFREVNAFRGNPVDDIVDLHKLGLPVNEANLNQIASYKNLTHQLVDGMNTVLEALPGTLQEMVQDGNVEGAAKMLQDLLQLVKELPKDSAQLPDGQPTSISEGGTLPPDGQPTSLSEGGTLPPDGQPTSISEGGILPPDGQTAALSEGGTQVNGSVPDARTEGVTNNDGIAKIVISEAAAEIADTNTEALLSMSDGRGGRAALNPENIIGTVRRDADISGAEAAGNALPEQEADEGSSVLSRELIQLIRQSGGDEGKFSTLLQQLDSAVQKGDIAGQADVLQKVLQQGIADNNKSLLNGLTADQGVRNLLREGLSRLWTIEPEDVADGAKVDALYKRLDRQLKGLSHILEQGGRTESAAFRAVSNMSQNLDFLQQLNHAYTYVQLPLRLQQGEAHGDLYVYTNKRSLAAKDGQISALLHLDMEHLGPVDVYVAMQSEKVSTRFYVQDDSMLDFLEQHMDLLTERLQRRGYNCSFAMQVREKGDAPESGINGLMVQEKGRPIAQYAFDMRA